MNIKALAVITDQKAFRLTCSDEKDDGDMARMACMAALVLTLATAGQVAGNEASWMPALRHILEHEQRCTLGEVLWTREVPVGKETALEGRARCLDGRQFDFSQRRPHMKFDVRLCQPTFC